MASRWIHWWMINGWWLDGSMEEWWWTGDVWMDRCDRVNSTMKTAQLMHQPMIKLGSTDSKSSVSHILLTFSLTSMNKWRGYISIDESMWSKYALSSWGPRLTSSLQQFKRIMSGEKAFGSRTSAVAWRPPPRSQNTDHLWRLTWVSEPRSATICEYPPRSKTVWVSGLGVYPDNCTQGFISPMLKWKTAVETHQPGPPCWFPCSLTWNPAPTLSLNPRSCFAGKYRKA